MSEWADVDVDMDGQMTCPIPRCDEVLYLNRTTSMPLYAEQQPARDDWVTDEWQVECVGGHVLYRSADQAQVTDQDPMNDSIEYDHVALHQVINQLGGERL